MQLKFSKKTLVYILLVLKSEKQNGNFVSDIVAEMERAVLSANKDNTLKIEQVSRPTLYNYFKDLTKVSGDDHSSSELLNIASNICDNHKRLADKFYKKFNEVMFDAAVSFLMTNGYLGRSDFSRIVTSVENNLYFSFAAYLNLSEESLEKDVCQLSGDYRVYRPSISRPGDVIVSCARIQKTSNGALTYEEVMHFRSLSGWRRQYLEGVIMSRHSDINLITKDTNTGLPQLSLLDAREITVDENGTPTADIMCGSYNGKSRSITSGLFTTGILMVRDNFKERPHFENFPQDSIWDWEIGQIEKFGRVRKNSVPEKYLRFLFEYYPDINRPIEHREIDNTLA